MYLFAFSYCSWGSRKNAEVVWHSLLQWTMFCQNSPPPWLVPWTTRRSKTSILKEINPEYSLEGLMLKLKLQYFDHLIWRADSLEKALMLGKTEGEEEKGMTGDEMIGWHHWLNGHEFEPALGNGEEQRSLVCYSPWDHKELDTTEQLNSIIYMCIYIHIYIYIYIYIYISDFAMSNIRFWESNLPTGWIPVNRRCRTLGMELQGVSESRGKPWTPERMWDVGDGRRTRAGESLRTKSGTGVPQKLYWAAAQNSQRCSSNLGRLRRDLPGSSADKESSCNAWRRDRLYPLQYSGLENSMDCIVREVSKSQTQLSNFHFQGL